MRGSGTGSPAPATGGRASDDQAGQPIEGENSASATNEQSSKTPTLTPHGKILRELADQVVEVAARLYVAVERARGNDEDEDEFDEYVLERATVETTLNHLFETARLLRAIANEPLAIPPTLEGPPGAGGNE